MKNTIGTAVTLTLFGESHGASVGAVLDGLCPGIPVDESHIRQALALRRPFGAISTGRVEPDEFSMISGVYRGKTTGAPLCILIPNTQQNSADYAALPLRPGHADYPALCKYHGFSDPRGGGHFSGRLTAPIAAAGAILLDMLARKGIRIGTHILRCAGISDRAFGDERADIEALSQKQFAVLDDAAGEAMQAAIRLTAANGDSVGGILETAAVGIPAGVGEPWFDGMESALARALFAIPAVKGVSFGDGFDLCDRTGSEANDAYAVEDGRIVTVTNHGGGIGGGITNGMPLRIRIAIKPTPSIRVPQQTVDPVTMEQTTISVPGRHDPAIVHRARIVADSMTALVLCDLLTQQFGTDGWRDVCNSV